MSQITPVHPGRIPYANEGELPFVGETFAMDGDLFTVLAAREGKMLLLRQNNTNYMPISYIVAHSPRVDIGPLGENEFSWWHGHYYDVVKGSDGLLDLMAATDDYRKD